MEFFIFSFSFLVLSLQFWETHPKISANSSAEPAAKKIKATIRTQTYSQQQLSIFFLLLLKSIYLDGQVKRQKFTMALWEKLPRYRLQIHCCCSGQLILAVILFFVLGDWALGRDAHEPRETRAALPAAHQCYNSLWDIYRRCSFFGNPATWYWPMDLLRSIRHRVALYTSTSHISYITTGKSCFILSGGTKFRIPGN